MTQNIDELSGDRKRGSIVGQKLYSTPVKPHVAEREAAYFPAYRDLSGFDFSRGEVHEALNQALHQGMKGYLPFFPMDGILAHR